MENQDNNMKIVSEKLTKENFHGQKFRTTNFLKGKGFQDYIEGANNEAAPKIPPRNVTPKQAKLLQNWHQNSTRVMYWLSINVLDSSVGHIQDANSPKDEWENLIKLNANKEYIAQEQAKHYQER